MKSGVREVRTPGFAFAPVKPDRAFALLLELDWFRGSAVVVVGSGFGFERPMEIARSAKEGRELMRCTHT